MVQVLCRNNDAWIFKEPVDEAKLNINDYYQVIKEPMDFGTVKEKLRSHQYTRIEEFIKDVQLIFANCFQYNGHESRVAEMARNVQKDFKNQFLQLNFKFYVTDPDFDEESMMD